MTKKQAVSIIVISFLLIVIFNIFFEPILAAKISTWPLLNRLHILSPQAPIVINNRQTVRVDNNGDIIAAIDKVKSQLSAVLLVNNGTDVVAGYSLNLTSDGDFVTAQQTFSQTAGNYFVLLSDGRSGKIISKVSDPATSLVFFKASLDDVPVINLAESKNAGVGDEVAFVNNSVQNYTAKAALSNISFTQNDLQGQAFLSDFPRSSFGTQPALSLANGEALINTDANILALWNGTALISSDVLSQAVALYLGNNQKIVRPAFGFSYEMVTQSESVLTSGPQGAKVLQVTVSSPARAAGLLAGDVITSIGGSSVNENSPLEEQLQNYKPGDKAVLIIERKNQSLTLNLTVGELH